MASKRRRRRNECGGKRRFATQAEAVALLIVLRRKDGERMHSYKCPFCHCWHIGHMGGMT
jgi:hypothetical protein